jgi:hypothetical protein
MPHSTPTGAHVAPAPTTKLASPEFTTELLAALDAGYEIERYLAARSAGISHIELLSLELPPSATIDEYVAARAAGATHTEIKGLLNVSDLRYGQIELSGYARARQLGASHQDIIDAHYCGVDTDSYAVGYAAGATHHEMVSMSEYLGHYSLARAAGATHQDVLDAEAAQVEVVLYLVLRKGEVSHSEALEAQRLALPTTNGLGWYLEARERHHNHQDALALMEAKLRS